MFEKKMGFEISVTTRQRMTDIKNPGLIGTTQLVLVVESIVKAMQQAVAQCPGDRTIIAISIAEIPVFMDARAGAGEGVKEEKKDAK